MADTEITTMADANIAQGVAPPKTQRLQQQLRHRYRTHSRVNVGMNERGLSVAGGAMLAAFGFRRGGWTGTALAALGGELIWRGVSGHCVAYQSLGIDRSRGTQPVHVTQSVIINRPAARIYSFWRNFENLPSVMQHLESVTETGNGRTHWKAKAPAGQKVEWDAVIDQDVPNEFISWHALEGSQVWSRGSVRFRPSSHGTEVIVDLEYEPPAGSLGQIIAKVLGEEPEQQVREDLRHLKQMMETGELPTTEGQPAGGVQSGTPGD